MNLRAFLLTLLITPLVASTQRYHQPRVFNEIIYHVFLRSFYDSNGDGHGDFKGLQQKLDYLQQLGVTSILMLPIQSSPYYHNYFSDDFKKIDPEFGDMKSYLELVKEVHRRKMRIYLDIETQYVIEDHAWWKDSYNNPSSKHSDFILYNDKENTKPEPIIFNLTAIPGYNGVVRKAATVNLLSKNVLDYNIGLFKFWMDPNDDGKFDDGADGFRLDHAMDDLDWKGKLTGLLENFWQPLLSEVKRVNRDVTIIAEQAYWADYGNDYFKKAAIDMVFGFQAQSAFVSFNKQKLQDKLDSTLTGRNMRNQVIFIENHDIQRFASAVNQNLAKEKIGAAFNLLTGGVPSIYYGQEIGMFGKGGFGKFGGTDGNDIPMREAFEWYHDTRGKGMALWYKDSGPWWDSTNLKPDDGISLEEGKAAPGSLYNYYKQLIALRRSKDALSSGNYKTVLNTNDSVFSFLRQFDKQMVLVMINLSGSRQDATLTKNPEDIRTGATWKPLLHKDEKYNEGQSFSLKPYEVQAWEIF